MVISGVYKDETSMENIINHYKHGEVITIESLNQIKLVDKITKDKKCCCGCDFKTYKW